jgi:hypothetical protein
MLFRILYSPYDAGAFVIMLIGLGWHILADLGRSRRAGSGLRGDP